MSAANELQAAIFARLSGDAALAGLVAGGTITDRLTTPGARPALRFGAIESGDYSTASEPGEEHRLAIEVRGEEGGHKAVQAVAARLRALLHDQALTLPSHILVNLRHQTTRTRRDGETRGHRAELMFRAVTEPR
ncbi:DUF3168 domain-containing protein [Rhizobium sp. CC-YZS058]|uniref:DUF3168 domain-containing protein n=1 Tax=Rhizobium sp. CC-YZS058 TaxID=3042153 RepID=UPI002B059CFA|nr:DUF3168 domain-containing protein [Rhizobium sp. CC-YZS058]MEA3535545.1 DUF3168 domain-containing protein [Rhizobium sp. CC-YZS058]